MITSIFQLIASLWYQKKPETTSVFTQTDYDILQQPVQQAVCYPTQQPVYQAPKQPVHHRIPQKDRRVERPTVASSVPRRTQSICSKKLQNPKKVNRVLIIHNKNPNYSDYIFHSYCVPTNTYENIECMWIMIVGEYKTHDGTIRQKSLYRPTYTNILKKVETIRNECENYGYGKCFPSILYYRAKPIRLPEPEPEPESDSDYEIDDEEWETTNPSNVVTTTRQRKKPKRFKDEKFAPGGVGDNHHRRGEYAEYGVEDYNWGRQVPNTAPDDWADLHRPTDKRPRQDFDWRPNKNKKRKLARAK